MIRFTSCYSVILGRYFWHFDNMANRGRGGLAAQRREPGREKEPPVFHGTPREDVVEWLKRYRETAEYNFWTPGQSLHHVKWALADLARDWYDSLPQPLPDTFDDIADALIAAFKHPAYESGLAAQLRSRKQGVDESPVAFCYAVLSLCNKVDPAMVEATKIQHLLGGLKPAMVDRIYPFIDFANPDSREFIRLVQLHNQASWIAQSNGWANPGENQFPMYPLQVPGTSTHKEGGQFVTQDQLASFEKRLTSKLETDLKGELAEHKKELQKGFGELLESVGKTVRNELKANKDFRGTNDHGRDRPYDTSGNRASPNVANPRTADGKPICRACGKVGHLARNCWQIRGGNGKQYQNSQKTNQGDKVPENKNDNASKN